MDANKSEITGEVKIVSFSYDEISNTTNDLSSKIEEAFGPEGYGICIVRDIPNYVECRAKLLPLSRKLGNLPKEKLSKLELPQHFHSVGWSHGKEKFLGKPDYSKGSFYANPQYDNIHASPDDVKDGDAFAPNVWPTEDIPELEPAFKELGCLVVEAGTKLAKHIDKYVAEKLPSYEKGKITGIIENSKCCKARLLNYFPSNDMSDADSDWCGWHNDHGTLTGLTSAMYIDKEGKELDFKDPESGLFVQKRSAEIKKAAIPKDCLAFQIGESAQIHSGGLLLATPHTVLRGPKLIGSGVCRDTFAVFMQPNKDEKMNAPEGVEKQAIFVKETFKVPKLQDRWNENQTFEEFATATIKSYSNTTMK